MYHHISNRPHANESQSNLPTRVTMTDRITVRHGHVVLYLRTQAERDHPSYHDSVLLNTYQPVGTAGRMQQLEYLLNPVQAQFGFIDTNTLENVNDIAGRGRIQYTLSESDAKKKLNEQKHGSDSDEKLETVDRKYAENFEWAWRDFDERFEETFEDKPWSN